MDIKELTLSVCDIAKKAGGYIREERRKFSPGKIERKHEHDYVSYVDKQSETLIVDRLKRLLPEAGFITEEGSAQYNNEQYVWVVDPLDGTTNFIHSYMPYAVSIALCQGEQILSGVVYEIWKDECFYAWQGGGAWLDSQPLQVSNLPINEALLGIELPYNAEQYSSIAHSLIEQFYGKAGGIRMNGSAAMALCYVAAGRMDGWLEKHIGRWDYMAGALIVEEAGGKITNFSGSANYKTGNEIVASNGIIHSDLLQAVKKAVSTI
jgi:myo-inositol-1(or 4)-monophosphatase